ncbi:MAG: hypothetical protein HYT19_01680 [Candidatus Nealsonbacteria bacterium]|nr:hypothetical protein [Candidatus Nealsonbacteria bacterium]
MNLLILNSRVLKILLLALTVIFLVSNFSPVKAAGLVPCGGTGEPVCGFCHIFVLFNNIVNFLFRLVPPAAAFMLMVAGVKFFMAVDNPGEVKNAQNVIKSVIIGLIIIYGAWALVGAFLSAIGLATWTQNIFSSWWSQGLFQINCPTP